MLCDAITMVQAMLLYTTQCDAIVTFMHRSTHTHTLAYTHTHARTFARTHARIAEKLLALRDEGCKQMPSRRWPNGYAGSGEL